MKIGHDLDLTYCSNIHPGESWSDVFAQLGRALPRVRDLLGATGPFGIGLRLSAAAARELDGPEALQHFLEFLSAGNYYVPTINGFPYGAFHGTRVKEHVYLPDWRDPRRLDYTNRLARLLAGFASHRGESAASVSTVPGMFRANVQTENDVTAMATAMLHHAAYLVRLREETGVTISLAIEPEPACYLETVDDAVRYFESYLFNPPIVQSVARESGVALSRADVARHVGLCLDTCHMAVEFEDPAAAFARVRAEGIGVYKVQLSSALRVAPGPPETARSLLAPFAEDTYLHQVVTARGDALTRYTDLPDALADTAVDTGAEWRVHFHVPIFLDAMSGFATTQPYVRAVLDLLARTSACRCLEVETYTWDVLPREYRTTDVCTAIARELAWVRGVLSA
jgi:hypothetical protein